ncbi:MAG: hypothetical protein L0027_05000 [Candidatus Rokubacteria bacterium]|nr:hypothetical protein [Candidatus Rokubacteria bacterium]
MSLGPTDRAVEPRAGRRWRWLTLAAGIALVLVAALAWIQGPWARRGFVEFKMLSPTDIPVGIAAAPDGTVWFTIEFSDAIGRVRGGVVEKLRKGSENMEPLGLAIDGEGHAWYTDAPLRAISRVSPDGSVTSFGLSTPVTRLGRLASAPGGGVWFAEPSTVSVTHLRDGRFTRYPVGPFTPVGAQNAGPFGVAVAGDGAVWATLQNANKLVRILPGGEMTEIEVPTRRSGLGDIAIDPGGAVWFLETSANKIGRYAGGRFEEFPVPTPSAGLTALAIAPDGAAWFTELRAHKLGRVRDGVVTEFPLPRPDARPIGVAVDLENNVWYTDLGGWVGRLAADRARSR